MQKRIFDEIKDLITEARNPASMQIDRDETEEILRIINSEDKTVAAAVENEIPYIAEAVDMLVETFKQGGRLFYIGAGTSGRLGVLDASECPPTYGTNPEMVQGIMAGGDKALIASQEGSEDFEKQGIEDLKQRGFTAKDVACGIAAGFRTPYVLSAIQHARKLKARTIFITCTPRLDLKKDVGVAICPVVGPEVVMGSTRMKAGTATKMVLNMLTTASMIRLGKVYENMMVDLQMTSRKLEERSKRTVMIVTGVGYEEANKVLKAAAGHVKTALVMILAGVDAQEARLRLQASNGFVRKALEKT